MAEQSRVMLPREDFGRGEQRRLLAALDRGQHRRDCDQSLPDPTSPGAAQLGTAWIGPPRISRMTFRWALVSWYGSSSRRISSRAGKRRRAMPPLRMAQQQQRELVGEDSS